MRAHILAENAKAFKVKDYTAELDFHTGEIAKAERRVALLVSTFGEEVEPAILAGIELQLDTLKKSISANRETLAEVQAKISAQTSVADWTAEFERTFDLLAEIAK